MECFSHPSVQAVAICKTCCRAVCHHCAKDLHFAVVCCDTCAQEASEVNSMTQKSKKLVGIGANSPTMPGGVVVYTLFTLFFLGWGAVATYRTHQPDYPSFGIGTLFMVVTIFMYFRAKKTGLKC